MSAPYPSLSVLLAHRFIWAAVIKGLGGVTRTQWMSLTAFRKVEADLYERK